MYAWLIKILDNQFNTYWTVRFVDILAAEKSTPVVKPTLMFPFCKDRSKVNMNSVSDMTVMNAILGAKLRFSDPNQIVWSIVPLSLNL